MKITTKKIWQVEANSDEFDSLRRLTLKNGAFRWWLSAVKRNSKEDITICVARDKGKIVGWATIRPNRVSKLANPSGTKHSVGVFVAPSQRRKGIGTELISAVVAAMPKVKEVACCMHNGPAASFYGSQFGAEVIDGETSAEWVLS